MQDNRMSRRRLWCGVVAAVFMALVRPCDAWQSPKARDIQVTTNGFTHTMGTNVQTILTWIDTNMLTSADGLVDTTTLDSRLSSTSTQLFGKVGIVGSPTNANVTLGKFHGFKASLTNGSTFHITTNTMKWVKIQTETNLHNVYSWYSGGTTSQFTPLVAGYYFVGAEIGCTTNASFQIVSQYTNESVYVGSTQSSNTYVSGGGIVYATGTSTNYYWLEGIATLSATSAPVTRAVFYSHYLGGN